MEEQQPVEPLGLQLMNDEAFERFQLEFDVFFGSLRSYLPDYLQKCKNDAHIVGMLLVEMLRRIHGKDRLSRVSPRDVLEAIYDKASIQYWINFRTQRGW